MGLIKSFSAVKNSVSSRAMHPVYSNQLHRLVTSRGLAALRLKMRSSLSKKLSSRILSVSSMLDTLQCCKVMSRPHHNLAKLRLCRLRLFLCLGSCPFSDCQGKAAAALPHRCAVIEARVRLFDLAFVVGDEHVVSRTDGTHRTMSVSQRVQRNEGSRTRDPPLAYLLVRRGCCL